MPDKTTEEQINDGRRIAAFIKDECVDSALSRMERKYYEEFKASTSSEERVRSWAKARVLDDFLDELRAIVSTGERAATEQERNARRFATHPPTAR